MSKQILSIDGFGEGIVNDETRQSNKGFVDMYGLDPWTEDGVVQINKRLVAETTTSLTEPVLSFTTFDGKKIAGAEGEEMWYESSANTWTLMHTNTNNGDNEDLIVYQDYLIYASIIKLGRSTTTAIAGGFTDSPTWGSGTNFSNGTSGGHHYFKIFNNRLYISDGNFLAELDGASDPATPANWIFTAEKFTLPVNENIKSLEVIGSLLAIGTEDGNLYFWDGSSANATQIIKTTLGGLYGMLQLENTLFVFAGTAGTVYRYNGADLIPVIQIPNFNISTNNHVRKPSVRRYKNGMIFGIRGNGLYVYNRVNSNEPFALVKYGATAGGVNNDVLSIYIDTASTDNDDFIVGIRETDGIERTDSTDRYRMEEAGTGDTSGAARFDTFVYELRDNKGQKNKVQGVQGLFKGDGDVNVKNSLEVEYRLDRTQAYTVLGQIGETGGVDLDAILRGIGKRTDTIELRIKFGSKGSVSGVRNTKLTGLKIF